MGKETGAGRRRKKQQEAERPRRSAREWLHDFLALFQKEDTVLVAINADPDALAAAMAVKRLLRYRVRSVAIGYPNEIRRLNNLTMVGLLKIPAERLQAMKGREFTKRVLVDSQPGHHPAFENLKFDAVIDHHPLTSGWSAPFVDIRPNYGATASIMVEYLRAAGMKPSVALATALFYAIKVDTQNFEKKATQADAISFRYLFAIANQVIIRKIELSDLRLSELNYFRQALTEMKLTKGRLYAHIGRVRTPDVLVIIADFFNQVAQISWVFVSGIHGERLVVIFRCDGYKKNAGRLAEKIFGPVGSAGGHRECARAEVPLKNLPGQGQEFTTRTLMRLTTKHLPKDDGQAKSRQAADSRATNGS
ncbi:MAG: DHH family phosphoesterase [Thermodesulfobacteriota bacterium]